MNNNPTKERDTLQETHEKSMKWTDVNNGMFQYEHPRQLPSDTAQKAIDYIQVLTKQYPFQIRYSMAKPYWERFAAEWCRTGDEQSALRKI